MSVKKIYEQKMSYLWWKKYGYSEANVTWVLVSFLDKLTIKFSFWLSKVEFFEGKSSESSVKNLRSFEDSSVSENWPKMKTKINLRTIIFEASKIFEASLQHWYVMKSIFIFSLHYFDKWWSVWTIYSRRQIKVNNVFLCNSTVSW